MSEICAEIFCRESCILSFRILLDGPTDVLHFQNLMQRLETHFHAEVPVNYHYETHSSCH